MQANNHLVISIQGGDNVISQKKAAPDQTPQLKQIPPEVYCNASIAIGAPVFS